MEKKRKIKYSSQKEFIGSQPTEFYGKEYFLDADSFSKQMCPMPEAKDTEKYPVFAWTDMTQIKAATERAKLAWVEKYGMAMPPSSWKIRRKEKGDD